MTIDREKMDELFSNLDEGASVAVLTHPSPDPDCLGGAAGISLALSEAYSLNTKIFHYGEVSHPQNKSMKNVLRIQLADGRDFKPEDFQAIVVIDTDVEGSGFKAVEKADNKFFDTIEKEKIYFSR